MKTDVEKAIQLLANRAANPQTAAHEAQQLAQAALNLAHVLATLSNAKLV